MAILGFKMRNKQKQRKEMEEKVDNDADEQYQKDKSNEYVTFALDPKIRVSKF